MPLKKALILIDIQPDFLPGGALAVPGGNEILEPVAELADFFDTIVATQDWHPTGHKSFASSHNTQPFSTTTVCRAPGARSWPCRPWSAKGRS